MSISVFGIKTNVFNPIASSRNATASRAVLGTTDSSGPDVNRLKNMVEKGGKVAEIVERYNLRNISYTDLQSMTKELMDAGALQPSQMIDFLPPSMEYASLDGSRNANWNAPKDYIGLVEKQIAAQENGFFTDARTLKYLKSQLELLQRFEQPTSKELGFAA